MSDCGRSSGIRVSGAGEGEEKRRTGDWCAWEVRVGWQWGHGTLGSGTVMDRLDVNAPRLRVR